ncbi:MAG: Gfo/Idh/MocA family oxidoreductase [Sedimentisphaerales bacterium]|nr:Gfo/Idh/MocA family oxidoreductase [Sedimentisphaerales bacterium]
MSEPMNRREFIGKSSLAAAFTILPRRVLGGAAYVAPSEKVRIGYVGCGTQGLRQLIEALPNREIQIAAVCDPNRSSADYVEWGKHEIRDKIRNFLGDPAWGAADQGCRCGRAVGHEIVSRYYAKNKPSGSYQGCQAYVDFREMLAQENDLDAVYIMTPDHLHATIALAALRKGKHVIVHKPLSNVLAEARLVAQTAQKTRLATHLFCTAGKATTPLLCEWIGSGAIGPVREVHNWSSRPFWPQGMTERPPERPAVPDGMDWDLWLGPVPPRPYHPAYTHAVFRGWYDFGTGALGDMGHYSFYQIFQILKLGCPVAVEATRSQYWKIVDSTWQKQENRLSYPRAATIRFEFPARGDMPPVTLTWYDGGLRPAKPKELDQDGLDMPAEGLLFVGDNGKILCGFSGDDPRLIPEARMKAFQPPPKTLPRPIGELEQWLAACKGGESSGAAFEKIYPFSETICLGTIALRVDKKLAWDTERFRFANSEEANGLMHRTYRPGWELS